MNSNNQHAPLNEGKEETNQNITYEGLVIQLAKAYISAGCNGMPPPAEIVKLAIETADEIYKQLEINLPHEQRKQTPLTR